MTHLDGARNTDAARPEHAHGDMNAGGTTATTPSGRKLVVFADGTGNAFTAQESSVWRLYQALDHNPSPTRSPATSRASAPPGAAARALDGATGIGVPGNVRKLYRFLCWNLA